MECCCDKTAVIKALSDETRLEIIDMLSEGELCACRILEKFEITQPTLSYHMKILTESGIVTGRREGAWMHYSLNRECVKALIDYFNVLLEVEGQQKINCKGGC
jgi:ArsR family transcriptional regulator, arsenate/arsenite/antimonite-responsive transcriptional repressor